MSESDLQTALLVIEDLGLLITIGGWIYTGAQQRTLLRETRAYQRIDRDLIVHRARMGKAGEITKSLITSSDTWYKLAGLAKACVDDRQPGEFFKNGLPLLWEGGKTKLELAIVLYDPEFRALRDLLPEAVSKRIYDSLKASSARVQSFHEKTYEMQPGSPNLGDQLKTVYEEGKAIGDDLVTAADGFADAFAQLDKRLTDGDHKKNH